MGLIPKFVALAMVAFTAVARAQSTPSRAKLTEDLRLDANKEDFSRVNRIYVGPHGQFAVPLTQDRQIRLYDSMGRQVARVGRRGSGPGEFTSLGHMGWLGDSLWVSDVSAQRMTYVAPNGNVIRTVSATEGPLKPPAGVDDANRPLQVSSPVAVYSDGTMLLEAWLGRRSDADDSWRPRIVARTAGNGATRLVGVPPKFEDDRWFMTVAGFGNDVPFMLLPQTVYAYDGSRLAHLWAEFTSKDAGRYVVSLFRAQGDTVFTKSFPFTGTPIPQRARDSALAEFLPKPGQGSEGPSDLGQRFQALARQRMPSVYIPVQTILLGLDNTVWLLMRATAEGRVAIVLNERGEPIASVLTPANTIVRQASRSRIWATETDDDGLSSVVRYKVTGIR